MYRSSYPKFDVGSSRPFRFSHTEHYNGLVPFPFEVTTFKVLRYHPRISITNFLFQESLQFCEKSQCKRWPLISIVHAYLWPWFVFESVRIRLFAYLAHVLSPPTCVAFHTRVSMCICLHFFCLFILFVNAFFANEATLLCERSLW